MKKKYSKAQIDYLAAKEMFLLASKQADVRVTEFKKLGEITQEQMEEAIEKSGFQKAYNELIKVENNLIEWSRAAINEEKMVQENKVAFEVLYEKVKSDPQSRAILIDMAMKLELI